MAKIVIVTHEFDVFARLDAATGELKSPYLLFDVLKHAEDLGHHWEVTTGPRPVEGDVAVLHVDASVVSDEYLALAAHYPAAINFGTGDITKRRVSRQLLAPDEPWEGPVILKANLNCGGMAEVVHNRRARNAGLPVPHAGIKPVEHYQVLDDVSKVPDEIWGDKALVVERLMPERDDDGFAFRTWVFMGSHERCTRFVTPKLIGKAADALRFEPIEVPKELRAERERLGFDFGKFDWVMHDGAPILLDANRTPGTARAIEGLMSAGAANLAEGLDELVRQRA